MTIWVGLDLGNNGGIAIIDDTLIPTSVYDHITLPECWPMPKTDIEKWKLLE